MKNTISMINVILLINFVISLLFSKVYSDNFSYRNVYDWKKISSDCGGNHQSPINIPQNVPYIKSFSLRPKFVNYDKRPVKLFLRNVGHTVQLSGKWNRTEVPKIIGDGIYIQGNYIFQQMHFHWGQPRHSGTEHIFNGLGHQIEAHLVHVNSKYKFPEEALNYGDGLIVLAHTYEISSVNNLARLDKLLQEVMFPNCSVNVYPFALEQLNVQLKNSFYTYKGSLTTPPCSEVVTWFINTQPLGVSSNTLSTLRHITLSEGDVQNIRPVQPLYNRFVLKIT